jgi:hypothetical protein
VITQKYADHLPLHRQQEIFRRQGVHLPRSTLGNLVQGGAALLGTITEAMWQDARAHAAWLAIDATGVLVLAAEQCRRGHFWVVVTENGHVLFRYTRKHDGSVPVEMSSRTIESCTTHHAGDVRIAGSVRWFGSASTESQADA